MLGRALAVTAIASPGGVVTSSDPGAPRPHLVLVLLPTLLLITAVTFAPPRLHSEADGIDVLRPRRAAVECAVLLAVAAVFPLLIPLLPLPEDYVLLKAAMLLVIAPLAMLAFARFGGGASLSWERPAIALPWLLVPVGIAIGADARRATDSFAALAAYPMQMLIVGGVATAITAGIGEEVFYRRLLQTRLEALLGRWSGILLTSILFALMHLPSHGLAAGLGLGAAQVLAVQGLLGIALGWAWSRYRRLWVPILIHLSVNGTVIVLFLFDRAL